MTDVKRRDEKVVREDIRLKLERAMKELAEAREMERLELGESDINRAFTDKLVATDRDFARLVFANLENSLSWQDSSCWGEDEWDSSGCSF